MRPNFIVIGAMKCATTSLCNALAQHAQIFVSDPKEPSFFSDEQIFARGMGWYESLFAGAEGKIAMGEGSTSYTKRLMFPGAGPRIAAHLPDARLIYIVRHPMERIESHWVHNLAGTLSVPRDFNTAVREMPHYIDASLYGRQIGAYREHFADDRILVLFFEDWKNDPAAVLARCYQFLGVEPAAPAADAHEPQQVESRCGAVV